VNNLWLLGGEIIRDLNYDPSPRKKTADVLLRTAIDDDGGPLIHNGSEEDQRSFDTACRKLHRFLTPPPRSAQQLPTDSPEEAALLPSGNRLGNLERSNPRTGRNGIRTPPEAV
jgi:hypothetical protein